MTATPLATPDDVAVIWHTPLTDTETAQVTALIATASAKLRQASPFDIDARILLFTDDIPDPTALDPTVVANVVATIVKRFLVNPDGYATQSQSVGPYSLSGTFVNRYDKTGSDVRGSIQVIDSDIDELRPSTPFTAPSTFQQGVPNPSLLIPAAISRDGYMVPVVVPDFQVGHGVE